jgi:hypothetical protein
MASFRAIRATASGEQSLWAHIDPTEKKAAVQGMLTLIRGGAGKHDQEAKPDSGAQTGTSTGTCPPETGTSGDSVVPEMKKPRIPWAYLWALQDLNLRLPPCENDENSGTP